jgi:predicted helicase
MTAERPKHSRASATVCAGLFNGITSFKQLEHRIAALPTEAERGVAFEVFAEAYLATQPIEKAKNVWPERRIPEQVRRRLRLYSRDVGVDGLIETVSGTLRAYQVKFRTGRPALRWEETATFFGLTDRCEERLLFTNCDDLSAVMDERRDFSSIRGSDLDRLEPSDFKTILSWLRGAKVVREIKKPRPHQTKALKAIIPAQRKQNRATAVMACGTGKTQVALWTAEAIAKRRVLVLVPSLALLRQTLKEWINQTKWKRYDYLCVCSDPTVSRGEDELVIRPTELEFSVSTEPRQVRQFLQRPFTGVKIIFSTYQSAAVVAKGMRKGDAFDLAIFDEAHKTAGLDGTQFSFALKDKNLPIRKRLFLTATPRHYNINKRDKEGDPVEVFSMNRPEIYGPVVHNLTFAEAARRGIICNYKVIISVVTSTELTRQQLRHGQVPVKRDRVKAAQVANQIALAQAVRRHPIRKIFTFHRTVDSAASFTADGAEGIQNHLKQSGTFHVRGSMPSATRERVMDEFRAAPKGVMSKCPLFDRGHRLPGRGHGRLPDAETEPGGHRASDRPRHAPRSRQPVEGDRLHLRPALRRAGQGRKP